MVRILRIQELPIASINKLGGIKVGSNLSIDGSGILSAVSEIGGDTDSIRGIIVNDNEIGDRKLLIYDHDTNTLIYDIPSYIHNQIIPSEKWEITHNLKKYPSVSIVDSSKRIVIGDIKYISNMNIEITFTSAFSGKAYLN